MDNLIPFQLMNIWNFTKSSTNSLNVAKKKNLQVEKRSSQLFKKNLISKNAMIKNKKFQLIHPRFFSPKLRTVSLANSLGSDFSKGKSNVNRVRLGTTFSDSVIQGS